MSEYRCFKYVGDEVVQRLGHVSRHDLPGSHAICRFCDNLIVRDDWGRWTTDPFLILEDLV